MSSKSGQVSRPKLVDMKVRLPSELREKINEASERNGGSMNGEIVSRLEKSFTGEDVFQEHLLPVMRAIAFDIWRIENRTGKRWSESREVAHAASKIASDYFDYSSPQENEEGIEEALSELESLDEIASSKIGFLKEVGAIKPKEAGRQAYIFNALAGNVFPNDLHSPPEDAVPLPTSEYSYLVALLAHRNLRLAIDLSRPPSEWNLTRGGEDMPDVEKVGVMAVVASLTEIADQSRKALEKLREAQEPENQAKERGLALAASLSGDDRGA